MNIFCKGIQTKKHPWSTSPSVSTNIHGIPTMCQLGVGAFPWFLFSQHSLNQEVRITSILQMRTQNLGAVRVLIRLSELNAAC